MLLRPQFVFFGDSITQRSFSPQSGWSSVIADVYQRKIDIINRGYSGYNTRWALPLVDHIFPDKDYKDQVKLVTVFFGANDAALADRTSSKQHVPLDEYTSNLRTIINKLMDKSIHSIILIAPPPVSEPHRIKHIFETYNVTLPAAERTNEHAGLYANACKQLGKEMNLPVIDVWSEFQKVEDWAERYLNDGLHFTEQGNQRLGELVLQQIQESYPGLVAETLLFDVPEWSEFAENNAESAGEVIEKHLGKRR